MNVLPFLLRDGPVIFCDDCGRAVKNRGEETQLAGVAYFTDAAGDHQHDFNLKARQWRCECGWEKWIEYRKFCPVDSCRHSRQLMDGHKP